MPRIQITEIDNTRPGGQSFTQDVVFIPGFVDIASYEGTDLIPYNTPTLISSLEEFKTKCGTRPAQFSKKQLYSDLNKSFVPAAIPSSGIIFTSGAYDPAYIMAKEILASGLSIVYQRLNIKSINTFPWC